jgi:hypothetical protein
MPLYGANLEVVCVERQACTQSNMEPELNYKYAAE